MILAVPLLEPGATDSDPRSSKATEPPARASSSAVAAPTTPPPTTTESTARSGTAISAPLSTAAAPGWRR
jgi:hypothetical protein